MELGSRRGGDWTAHCKLNTYYCKLHTYYCTLTTANWTLTTAHLLLQTEHYNAHTTYWALQVTHRKLHIVWVWNCTLQTAHRVPRTAQITLHTSHLDTLTTHFSHCTTAHLHNCPSACCTISFRLVHATIITQPQTHWDSHHTPHTTQLNTAHHGAHTLKTSHNRELWKCFMLQITFHCTLSTPSHTTYTTQRPTSHPY